jgi:integrase/recombinase XerD
MYDRNYDLIFSNSIFEGLCKEFIQYMRVMGQKFPRNNQYVLRDTCRRLNNMSINSPILTKETIETLATRRPGESQGTQAKRVRFLRQFATFMSFKGFEAYVYPKHSMPQYKYDFRPYLFSHEQIIAIFKAVDKIVPSNYSPKAHLVYPAILRIIYGCGLRSAEARKLEICNVNLDEGILFIKKSKNNTSRYVPMSESLTGYCRKYARDMTISRNSPGFFFPAPDGGYYHEFTLVDRCHKLFEAAGIQRLANGRFPRVHDLRHAHIGHSLAKLIKEEGMDVYTAVPLIAAYVGHTNLQDTERYLHLPKFDFCDIVKAGQSVIGNAIPEVIFHE